MVISLIAWIYISTICLIWGQMTLSALIKDAATSFNAPLICLAGLSIISTLALGLSLFMPLDWKAHCILLIPAITYCGKTANRHAIKIQLGNIVSRLSPTALGLLTVCILMVLIISVDKIVHPDTLYYHAGSILLFEKYKAIPGIANLKNEMGFQCGWFASLALFKLNIPSLYNVIFLNGTVLCWYLIFVVDKIAASFSSDPTNASEPRIPGSSTTKKGWAWLLLLAYTFSSWTQVRLTAASASPDFIVSLYSWAAFYIFVNTKNTPSRQSLYLSLIVLYSIGALLTKLSAITILLLPALALAGSFRLRPTKPLIAYSFVALIILFSKNWIASGYLLYPLPRPDIFHPAWKIKEARINNFQHYISTYARFPIDSKDVGKYWQAPFREWLPRWWELIAFPDKLLLLGILAGLVILAVSSLIFLAKGKQAPASTGKKYPVALLISLGGSVLWFLGAPSPRFGTGFLIPLLYFLYQGLPLPNSRISLSGPKFLSPQKFTGCLLLAVAGYTTYRVIFFFTPSELAYPAGIVTSAYEPLGCEEIRVDLLKDRMEIRQKTGPVNCINDSGGFSPRGTTISDGFKPVE